MGECIHKWSKSKIAVNFRKCKSFDYLDELQGRYFEYCEKCGALRLPKEFMEMEDDNG